MKITDEHLSKIGNMKLDEAIIYINSLAKHFNNPVYVNAAELDKQTRIKQINKGAEKYPETLNPDSWSIDDLGQHAFDELVDGGHYVSALMIKAKKLEKEVYNAHNVLSQVDGQIKSINDEMEYWRSRALDAEAERNEIERKLEHAVKNMKHIDLEA